MIYSTAALMTACRQIADTTVHSQEDSIIRFIRQTLAASGAVMTEAWESSDTERR